MLAHSPPVRRFATRMLAVLALSAGLAGCGDSTLGRDAPFTSSTANGSGLIVLGVRVTGEPKGHGLLFGDYNLNPVYTLRFNAVDDQGRLARPEKRVQICGAERLILRGAFSDCDPRQLQYEVIQVPAGRYVLTDFFYHADKLTVETNFVGTDATRQPSSGFTIGTENAPVRGQALRQPGRSFEVGPGEIVTIGQMTLDSSVAPVRIAMTRDDAAAQAALLAYHGISGTVVFRPVFGR